MFEHGQRGEDVRALQAQLVAGGASIVADGVWGPKSEAAWLASLKPPADPPRVGLWVDKQPAKGKEGVWLASLKATEGRPRVGLWVDKQPTKAEREGWTERLAQMGLYDYSMCAFGGGGADISQPPPPGPRLDLIQRIRERYQILHGRSPRIGPCLWADSRVSAKAPAHAAFLAPLSPHIDFVDLDAEEDARGFFDASARLYVRALKDAVGGVPIGVNLVPHYTPGKPSESPKQGEIALVEAVMEAQGSCDLFLQTYTAYLPTKAWTHNGLFRPLGGFQQWSAQVAGVWRGFFGEGLRVGLGFALHGQAHPKPHPQGLEAVKQSTREMLRLAPAWSPAHPPALRAWSSKHLNAKNRPWLNTLAQQEAP